MIECPFSRERMAEMRWKDFWPPSAIAAVANQFCDERVTPEIVLAWCDALGISSTPPPKPSDVLPSRSARAPRARKDQEPRQSKRITRTCAFCGAAVTRYACEFTGKGEIAYCNADHQRRHIRQRGVEDEKLRKAAGSVPELAVGLGMCAAEKLCHGPCGRKLPIGQFSVDVGRGDGRARICLVCNRAKSRDYYERNRDRQRARAAENKRRKRAAATSSKHKYHRG